MTENYQVGSLYLKMSQQRVMMGISGQYAPNYDINISNLKMNLKNNNAYQTLVAKEN